jgi:AraC-like DNA-binding protein
LGFHFSSQISKQAIRHHKNVSFTNEGQIALIEALGDLEIIRTSNHFPLLKGTITVATGFELYNPSLDIAYFRGVIFDKNNDNDKLLEKLDTISEFDSEQYLQLNQILNLSINTNEDITKMDLLLNNYIRKHLMRNSIPSETNKEMKRRIDPRLLIINRYIRSNYHQQLTLQDLADLIGCNHVYLSNMYSKTFNIPPMKYLQNIRMNKAMELISKTRLGIAEIAQKLGYVSSSQFGAYFKRHHGCTPYELRLNHMISANKSKYKS